MFIGENLRELRILNCLTQHDLSKVLGISEFKIWQYENNICSPSFEDVNKIKVFFNVKSGYFYKDSIINKKENINERYISLNFN